MVSKSTTTSCSCQAQVSAVEKPANAIIPAFRITWTTLGLILIPKCPLCIITYSSAVGMCGGATYGVQYPWVGLSITSLFLIGMFILLQWNFKGPKTFAAEMMLAVGGGMLLSYLLFELPEMLFYLGALTVGLAAWLNGNLLHFYFALIHKS